MLNSFLYKKALFLLSKREYSINELENRLKKYSNEKIEIQELINELCKKGYLSDERYINSFKEKYEHKYGINKIRNLLLNKVKNKYLIDNYLLNNKEKEYELALSLWNKKFTKKGADKKEILKQVSFLRYKGFSLDIIKKIVF